MSAVEVGDPLFRVRRRAPATEKAGDRLAGLDGWTLVLHDPGTLLSRPSTGKDSAHPAPGSAGETSSEARPASEDQIRPEGAAAPIVVDLDDPPDEPIRRHRATGAPLTVTPKAPPADGAVHTPVDDDGTAVVAVRPHLTPGGPVPAHDEDPPAADGASHGTT